MKFKGIYGPVMVLSVLFCILMCFSCVCAHDVNMDNGDYLSLNNSEPIVSDSDDVGSLRDLDFDIQCLSPGDVYNFESDYCFDDGSMSSLFYTGIVVRADNVTLNGNGHMIIGNSSAIFSIEADNVRISNLTIVDTNTSRYACDLSPQYYQVSPINWMGDNGTLSDCKFLNTSAINGGSIRWCGNNGLIDSCIFTNNTAQGVGGALYILGKNTKVRKSFFGNCTSWFSNDMIYLNPGVANVTLIGNVYNKTYDGQPIVVLGNRMGIDADWFYEKVYENVMGERIDLYEIIYSSMLSRHYSFDNYWVSEISYLDNGVKYAMEYCNGTFSITFNRVINDFDNKYMVVKNASGKFNVPAVVGNLIIGKTFNLVNITSMDDLFILSHERKYVVEDTVLAEYTIAELADIKCIKDISFNALKKYINTDLYINSTFLNIILPSCHTYETKGLGTLFDHLSKYSGGVVLNGNGSKLLGPYDSNQKKKWTGIKLDEKDLSLSITNLTIQGFNHGLYVDEGSCTLVNVKFIDNYCKYSVEHDWGAGILNLGCCAVINCTFINNYAKYGGGIYNQGLLQIDPFTVFINNTGYKSGKDITYVDSAVVIFNGTLYEGHGEKLLFANGTYSLDYHKGYSKEVVKYLLATGILSSFTTGFFIGFMCGGPIMGMALGGINGLVIGAVLSMFVLTHNYDYHRSNVNTALLFVGTSVAAGMLGGLLGGFVGQKYRAHQTEIQTEIKNNAEATAANSYRVDENIRCEDISKLRPVTDTSLEDSLKFANGAKLDIGANAYGAGGVELLEDPNVLFDPDTGMLYSKDGYGILPLIVSS